MNGDVYRIRDFVPVPVFFPTNVWEYDVLDYFPFADSDPSSPEGDK